MGGFMMPPSSFDDFLRRESANTPIDRGGAKETFTISKCPTPGCGCGALKPEFDSGQITGFACAEGCEFSVRRNVFTGDIMYFKLDNMVLSITRSDSRGMKFTSLGEVYTDWY
jgi:hypothetical protein